MEELRAQVAELESRNQAAGDQVLVPRKDKDELIKLRGEVGQLREQAKRLTREVETAKSQVNAAKAETAQVSKNMNELAQSSAAMAANMKAVQAAPNTSACINNLRQIDGAKQQWALEHNKQANSLPQPNEVAPYFPNGVPACPAGGVYTLNAVGQSPTCSIPEHKLPQ